MGESAEVRAALEHEVGAVKLIEKSCGLSPWAVSDYENMVSDPAFFFFVGLIKGEITGFLIARLITTDKNVAIDEKTLIIIEAELLNIAVSENQRENGVGETLLRRLLHVLSEIGRFSVFLEVRESNTGARAFYRKTGFQETGSRKGYYSSPVENAILMTYEGF